jgi:hypothetical protein
MNLKAPHARIVTVLIPRTKRTNRPDLDPEPACRSRATGRSVDTREWREVPNAARRLDTLSACEYCFDGPPDTAEITTAVISCSHPTVYHRPRADQSAPSTVGGESAGASPSLDDRPAASTDARETIHDVTELREGDGVLWQGQSTPLIVVGAAASPAGTVDLRGPNGGDYWLEGRPDCARAYYVSPGYACQSDLVRVPAPTHHEAV